VLMLAFPWTDSAVHGHLAIAPRPAAVHAGILVRLTASAVELPGGPTLPLGDAALEDTTALRAWLETELAGAYPQGGGEIVVDADATANAAVLVDIAEAASSRKLQTIAVLVRDDAGHIGAERVTTLPAEAPAPYWIHVDGDRFELRDATSTSVVSGPNDDGFVALDPWAAGIDESVVAIDGRTVNVQQLVDLQRALRGRECDLTAECYRAAVVLGRPCC
ncbi:MAG TPA: hypothetical protein VFG69_18390, partial [Nannocystaceae bacterium]|nr:hypothetical protein [Nannocystaceae bacterium]